MKMIKRFLKNSLDNYYKNKGFEVILKPILMDENAVYSEVFPVATYSPWVEDKEFLKIFKSVKGNTLVDIFRCYEIWELTQELSGLNGDFIEVGVWKGGTGAIMAAAANKSSKNSTVFLCDTFEGVVLAGENDNAYVGGEHSDTSVQIVKDLLDSLELKNTRILKGIFPVDSAHEVKNNVFKMCHIDVDVYDGAKEITNWVWEKLIVGGVIVFDDFGFKGTQGVKKFVLEQRGKSDRVVIHNLNGHGLIFKIS